MGIKIMKNLRRYDLDFSLALKYFQFTLNDANKLSSEILENVRFDLGKFFTLLPLDANVNKIHEFRYGGLLFQNPILEYGKGQKKSRHQIIPTIREELAEFIELKIQKNKSISCIFDDVTLSLRNYFDNDLFRDFGLFYEEEVYFLLRNEEISKEPLLKCLRASNAFWHSLCVLTSSDFGDIIAHKFTLEKIHEVCLNAKMIVAGAYDGENYVFWEKN
jgi:hypothetical protein